MPLYSISIQEEVLSPESKTALAAEIAEFHHQMTGLDLNYVKIVFNTFAPGNGFIGGEVGAAVILTVLIRTGRSNEYKRKMLLQLSSMLKRATGASDEQMLLAIQEAPASQAMEMGQIMPDVKS